MVIVQTKYFFPCDIPNNIEEKHFLLFFSFIFHHFIFSLPLTFLSLPDEALVFLLQLPLTSFKTFHLIPFYRTMSAFTPEVVLRLRSSIKPKHILRHKQFKIGVYIYCKFLFFIFFHQCFSKTLHILNSKSRIISNSPTSTLLT